MIVGSKIANSSRKKQFSYEYNCSFRWWKHSDLEVIAEGNMKRMVGSDMKMPSQKSLLVVTVKRDVKLVSSN